MGQIIFGIWIKLCSERLLANTIALSKGKYQQLSKIMVKIEKSKNIRRYLIMGNNWVKTGHLVNCRNFLFVNFKDTFCMLNIIIVIKIMVC